MKHFKLFFIFSVLLIYSCSDEMEPSLESTAVQIEKRQYTMEGFQPITACEANNLTYYIDEACAGTVYGEAIPPSMEAYNDLGIALNFTKVDNPEDAHMVFNCVELGGICGMANASPPSLDFPLNAIPNTQTQFPSGGTIGKDINLRINWTWCPCSEEELDLCYFMRTVMHEVAHSLGMYHNDIAFEDKEGINPIYVEGTTKDAEDPTSVMNSGIDCTPNCAFNENDITALTSLYPPVDIGILGPDIHCIGQSSEFCLTDEIEGIWYQGDNITVSGGLIPISRPSNCVNYSWDEPGIKTIYAEACGTIYSKQIFVEAPCAPPANPPIELQNICYGVGNSSCYTFNSPACAESLNITSSSPNVVILNGGTTICLASSSPAQENIELTVSANQGCGGTAIWHIKANDPDECNL